MTTPDDSAEQLAAWMKAAREGASLSTYEIAQRIGITQSKASRLERGLAAPTPDQVRAWAEATGTPQSRTAALIREAQRGEGTHKLRGNATINAQGLARRQRDMAEIYEAMTGFSEFSLSVVPGLLQVPAYATSVLHRLSRISSASGVAAAVSQRMNNQSILYDESRTFSFTIAESALRYQAGPKALMAAQAHKLDSVLTLPNVSVSVLPDSARANLIVKSGFVIYEIPDEPLVLVELLAGEAIYTALPDVQLYREAFDELRAAAVTGRGVSALIRTAQTLAE